MSGMSKQMILLVCALALCAVGSLTIAVLGQGASGLTPKFDGRGRCLLNQPQPQNPSLEKQLLFEKQAVFAVQRILASELDAELPSLPFADWVTKVVGPGAGIAWQLSECGDPPEAAPGRVRDIRACVEVIAVLVDSRLVLSRVVVGTFKKGRIGSPVFFFGVIENRKRELHMVRRLRDLPGQLFPYRQANRSAVKLPNVRTLKLSSVANSIPVTLLEIWSSRAAIIEEPPPPPAAAPPEAPQPASGGEDPETTSDQVLGFTSRELQPRPIAIATGAGEGLKRLGSVSWGDVISKVQPRYPAKAKKANAAGSVDVQVTISEEGRVIEAKSISGHLLLREAAEEAARQWVFKPAILNGVPVETQRVLTFTFKAPK